MSDIDIFGSRYGAHTLSFKVGSGLKLGGVANYLLAASLRAGLAWDVPHDCIAGERCSSASVTVSVRCALM